MQAKNQHNKLSLKISSDGLRFPNFRYKVKQKIRAIKVKSYLQGWQLLKPIFFCLKFKLQSSEYFSF